jgi:cysteine desulfurase family protein (TIGR01976 family)
VLDIEAIRRQFPALAGGLAAFDGPGGSQIPLPVITAITGALSNPLSNRGQFTEGERNAERIVVTARAALADLLGTDPDAVVFGRSATQLTYDFSRVLADTWLPSDEVVVTRLDHDANIQPWVQAAARAGATVRWADFDPRTGELTEADIEAVLTDRTRLVAVTAASNLIGTIPPLPAIAELVHAAGALLYVDGAHYAAHRCVDVDRLGADLFVCSPYKLFGPHLGVLAGRPELLAELHPDKLAPSSNAVPERFELGTLPYELLAGARAAVDFVAGLSPAHGGDRRERLICAFAAMEAHEDELRARLETGLSTFEEVTLYSRAATRTPTLLLTLTGHDTTDAYRYLARRGISAPSSSFYAVQTSRRLGLGDTGGLRIGLAPYNNTADTDRLLNEVAHFLRGSE